MHICLSLCLCRRLAQLRPSSSSETIAQIQRVAERLCQFIMGYESGYIVPQETEEDEEDEEDIEAKRRRRMKRRRRKRKTVEEEVEEGGREGMEGEEEEAEDGDDEHDDDWVDVDRSPSPAAPEVAKPAMPPVSPFGFDFFTHTNFEWQPAPSAVPQTQPATQQKAASATWSCPACTFINADDKEKCEICGQDRHLDMDSKDSSHQHQHDDKTDDEEDGGWACDACSFRNRPEAEQCEVCETKRGAKLKSGTGDGLEGTYRDGEGAEEEGKEGDGEVDEKEGTSDISSLSSLSSSSNSSGSISGSDSITGGGGSQLPGSWACAYCTWLNPPTAVICEVCEREGKRSGMAQLVKLEMARKQQQSQAAGTLMATRQAWSCTVCTFVNRKQAGNPPGNSLRRSLHYALIASATTHAALSPPLHFAVCTSCCMFSCHSHRLCRLWSPFSVCS